MPYATTADLPDRVKNHIPPHAQKIFMHVFNSVLEDTGDETRAFKSAWSKVHKNYGEPGARKWKKEHPFKYELQGAKSMKSSQDVWDIVKSKRVVANSNLDELWTEKRSTKANSRARAGMVTVRPTEFELHLPFFDKRLRDIVTAIPGSELAGEDTWKLPINGENMAEVAKLVHDKDFYMVDWIEMNRDPAMQKKRSPNSWGDVPVKDHGLDSNAKKGRGTDSEIEAAKSQGGKEEIENLLEKSPKGRVSHPGSRGGVGYYDTDGWHYGSRKGDVNQSPAPWQMTFGAYKGIFGPKGKAPIAKDISDERLQEFHRGAISEAIDVGRNVHPEVTKLYPNLAGIAAQKGNPGKVPVSKISREAIAAYKEGGSNSPKFRSLMHNALEKLPSKEFDSLWDKVFPSSEKSFITNKNDAVSALGKSLGLLPEIQDIPTETATEVESEEVVAVVEEVAVVPIEKSVGQYCFSCEKSVATGASFTKLPDSGYCNDCLTLVARTR